MPSEPKHQHSRGGVLLLVTGTSSGKNREIIGEGVMLNRKIILILFICTQVAFDYDCSHLKGFGFINLQVQ